VSLRAVMYNTCYSCPGVKIKALNDSKLDDNPGQAIKSDHRPTIHVN